LLNEAWEIKREIAQGVSNSQIDSAYASGISAGATGGKLLGAGGGGYFAFYVPSDTQERFAQEFSQRLLFKVSMEGAGVIHES
jgi:D-glycero-alpha-D-manno-heptose-7-phosphate kinase